MEEAPAAATELDLAPIRSARAASKFKGVTKTSSGKWQAQTIYSLHGEQRDLGTFTSVEEAARAVALAVRDGAGSLKEKARRAPRGKVSGQPPFLILSLHAFTCSIECCL